MADFLEDCKALDRELRKVYSELESKNPESDLLKLVKVGKDIGTRVQFHQFYSGDTFDALRRYIQDARAEIESRPDYA